ncbi:hypothetical protein [Runella zeae]|jgi:hypothetical protein|uniref:hypothetical protein n=1 Tax=Runella zeae TaxID=94255 RepID=UPI00040BD830|nr:hypothetical protein [Runella zeae]
MSFPDIITTLSDVSILLPFFIILQKKAVLKDTHFIIALYILMTFIRNTLSIVIEILRNIKEIDLNTVFLYNIHCMVNFWLISYLYAQLLTGKFWQYFIIVSNIFFIIFTLYDFETVSNWNTIHFNRFSYQLAGAFAIILLLQYFFQLLKKLEVPRLSNFPLFWFSSGALIYYAGTFFMYLAINSFNGNPDLGKLYWPIDAILSIAFNILATVAIWKVDSPDAGI